MSAKGEWMTPYIFGQPQFEKPILLYWLLRSAFDTWGATPFNARFVPGRFLPLLGFWPFMCWACLVLRMNARRFGPRSFLCTGAFLCRYGETVFTDMIFSVLILYSLFIFYLGFCRTPPQVYGHYGVLYLCRFGGTGQRPFRFCGPANGRHFIFIDTAGKCVFI